MNERTAALRRESLDTPPSISHERASLLTDFYRGDEGKHSVPVMRAPAGSTEPISREAFQSMRGRGQP